MFCLIIELKIFIFVFVLTISKQFAFAIYEPWIPQSDNRTDLLCNDECKSYAYSSYDNCCTCRSRPEWSIGNLIRFVDIEYIDRRGTAVITTNDDNSILVLYHVNRFLTAFPTNLCNFNIGAIILNYNHIHSIDDISCLKFLDTLELSFNFISYVDSNLISNLSHLRYLKLDHNMITSLDPFTLARNTALFHVDLSYNRMEKLDISNIVPEHRFCQYDFTYNLIEEITNYKNFKLDTEKKYYGGHVKLDSNKVTRFIVWTDIGVDDLRAIGKVFDFSWSVKGMKPDCDCLMEPYLALTEFAFDKIWINHQDVTCWNPPEYRGLSIAQYFIKGDRLDLLICNISYSEKCPKHCHCYKQPKLERIVVNCTNAGLTKLPEYVPEDENLTLIFKGNDIKVFEHRDYFSRTHSIDISNNSLHRISDDAFQNMKDKIFLDFSPNPINELPRSIQTINPCLTPFGKLILSCDCSHFWLTDWVINNKVEKCENITEIYCRIEGMAMAVEDIDWKLLCNIEDKNISTLTILLGVVVILVLSIMMVLYCLRFEMFLLTRKLTMRNHSRTHDEIEIEHDVFISFNDKDETISQWIIRYLDTNLSLSGYKTFISCRDETVGTPKEESLIKRIRDSKNYIVILCEKYATKQAHFTSIEWKHIWNEFRENANKHIIIVNYDQLDSAYLDDKRIKAFLRVGLDLDFSNRNHQMFKNIRKSLGDPIELTARKGNANCKLIRNIQERECVFAVNFI